MAKKLLIVLFVLLFGSTAYALKVGDKMPYMKGAPTYLSSWMDPNTGSYGERRFRDNDNGEGFKMEAYLTCNDVSLLVPFGVFDSIEDLVYLDPNMDGIIDNIDSPNMSIGSTAPPCP